MLPLLATTNIFFHQLVKIGDDHFFLIVDCFLVVKIGDYLFDHTHSNTQILCYLTQNAPLKSFAEGGSLLSPLLAVPLLLTNYK